MRSIRSRPTASPSSVRRSSERAANASRRRGSGSFSSARRSTGDGRTLVQRGELSCELALLEAA